MHDGERITPMIPPVGGGVPGQDTLMHQLGVDPSAMGSG
jgi:hypothetical protein